LGFDSPWDHSESRVAAPVNPTDSVLGGQGRRKGHHFASGSSFPCEHGDDRPGSAIDRDGVELSRRKTFAALERLERELRPSGYLVGDSFTVADLTAAALLSPFVTPPEFPYAPPPNIPEAIVDFRDSLVARPAFHWVVEVYRRHRGRSAAVDG
jgi:glutathione S-transferase